MARLITAAADQVRDFLGNHPGFAGSRPGQYQTGTGHKFNGVLLAGIHAHGISCSTFKRKGILTEEDCSKSQGQGEDPLTRF